MDFDNDFDSKGRPVQWRLTDRGWTNAKPMDADAVAARKGAQLP